MKSFFPVRIRHYASKIVLFTILITAIIAKFSDNAVNVAKEAITQLKESQTLENIKKLKNENFPKTYEDLKLQMNKSLNNFTNFAKDHADLPIDILEKAKEYYPIYEGSAPIVIMYISMNVKNEEVFYKWRGTYYEAVQERYESYIHFYYNGTSPEKEEKQEDHKLPEEPGEYIRIIPENTDSQAVINLQEKLLIEENPIIFNTKMNYVLAPPEYKFLNFLTDSKEKADGFIKKIEALTDIKKILDLAHSESIQVNNFDFEPVTAFVPEVQDALLSMDKGAISHDPIKTVFGWCIILLVDKRHTDFEDGLVLKFTEEEMQKYNVSLAQTIGNQSTLAVGGHHVETQMLINAPSEMMCALSQEDMRCNMQSNQIILQIALW